MSFDIECAGRKGIFPEAEVDPVIQIANILTVQGKLNAQLFSNHHSLGNTKPTTKNVFTLDTCGGIVGAHIHSFQKEEELLQKWSDFVVQSDPDIIIGYNINGFDFPYLLDRAKALKISKFPYLGRIASILF